MKLTIPENGVKLVYNTKSVSFFAKLESIYSMVNLKDNTSEMWDNFLSALSMGMIFTEKYQLILP